EVARTGAVATGPPPITVPDDPGRLIPSDAWLVAYVPSLDRVEARWREVVAAFDEEEAQQLNLAEELSWETGLDAALLDRDRPAVLALSRPFGLGARPLLTLVLPVTDPPVAAAQFREEAGDQATVVSSGGYVAASMKRGYAPGEATPGIARDLPAGDLSVRLDLRPFADAVRPAVELGALGALGVPGAERMLAWIEDVLDSVHLLEAGLTLSGGKAELRLALTFLKGSPLDRPRAADGAPLVDLAKSLAAGDYPIVWLMQADWAALVDTVIIPVYWGMLEGLRVPEELRRAALGQKGRSREVYELMGPSLALGGRIGDGGIEFVGVAQPKDPAAYLARFRELTTGGELAALGIGFTTAEVEVEGFEVDRFTIRFDVDQLMSTLAKTHGREASPGERAAARTAVSATLDPFFGRGGLVFVQGPAGNRTVAVIGRRQGLVGTAFRTAKERSGTLPAAAARALAAAKGETTFFLYLDLRAVMAGFLEIGRKVRESLPTRKTGRVPQVPAGPPVPCWIRCSSEGRTTQIHLRLDLGGLGAIIRGLD
ncbi:MAG: hypothetical protein ACE5JG_11190, partial [Planctomycetota bacterium]